MSMPLQLVFFGELIEGFTVDEVRRNLAEGFRLGNEQLDRMFGGKAVVLKRNLSDDEAARYITHLASLGARAQTRPMPVAANTSTFKVEPSVLSPLPPLTQSDGPLDPPFDDAARAGAGRRASPLPAPDTVPLETMVPLRAAPMSPAATLTPLDPFAPAPSALADVTCPTCGERQSMRVLCSNCATNLERALAAKAESESAARFERLDATRARRGLPPAGQSRSGFGASGHAHSRLPATASDEPPPLWGFGWEGRLGRLNYATGIWVLSAAMALVEIITHRLPMALGGIVSLLAVVAVFAMFFRLAALRFHDRGHSGWWNLIWAAPIFLAIIGIVAPRLGAGLMIAAVFMGITAWFFLLFFAGDDGDNAHGAPPHEGSVGALVLAILATSALGAFAPGDSPMAERLRSVGGRADSEVNQRLESAEARRAYATEYLASRDHKAFAASPDGSWGWVSEAATSDAAMTEALGTCEKHRPATQRPCELIDVNGRLVPR